MGMMKIGLDDNALSTTSKMKAMVFFSQNHNHYELVMKSLNILTMLSL
jgi:hypothetical protein